MSKFTFYTTNDNSVNWTTHCHHGSLVVLERSGSKWFLLRKKRGEREQRIPLRNVPDRVKNVVTWSGCVYLNNRTGRVAQFSSDRSLRDSYRPPSRPAPRRAPRRGDTADVAGAIAIGIIAGSLLK